MEAVRLAHLLKQLGVVLQHLLQYRAVPMDALSDTCDWEWGQNRSCMHCSDGGSAPPQKTAAQLTPTAFFQAVLPLPSRYLGRCFLKSLFSTAWISNTVPRLPGEGSGQGRGERRSCVFRGR